MTKALPCINFQQKAAKTTPKDQQPLRFEAILMDVYLKLFVSNTIADLKMSGKSCTGGFPSLPRQLTRKELDNMFKG